MSDTPVGYFTPQQADLVWRTIKELRTSGMLKDRLPSTPAAEPAEYPVWVDNQSGEEIPAFACMQITSATHTAGRTYLKVKKPDDKCGEYIFNNEYKIAIGGRGSALPWGITRMLGSGSAEPLKRYSADVGTWKIERDDLGMFIVYGTDDTRPGVFIGRHQPPINRKARWIVATDDDGQVEVLDFWEGEDPEESCPNGVTLHYPITLPCSGADVKLICCYNPEDDRYEVVNADLGTKDVDVMVDTDGDLQTGLFSWSTGNCGEIDYATRTIKVFDCAGAEEPPIASKSAEWSGQVAAVVTGVEETTNDDGEPCLTFSRVNVLACDVSLGTPAAVLLCGKACCDKVLYYQRFDSPGSVPAGATAVGDYDFTVEGSPLTDTVAEICFVPAEATAGWIRGSADLLLGDPDGDGGTFTRDTASPECCPTGGA